LKIEADSSRRLAAARRVWSIAAFRTAEKM
jgi:hypothetical protein